MGFNSGFKGLKAKLTKFSVLTFYAKKQILLLTLSRHRSQEFKTIKFCTVKVKVKFTLEQATKAQGVGEKRYRSILSLTSALDGDG